MKTSVVITTFNRRDLLARTLPTVLKQDFPSDQYEVVVVVDGSTDGTTELLRSFKPSCALRIIEQQPNLGQAAAQNAGLKAAQGEVVLFLDDDIVCEPALLQAHASAHTGAEPVLAFGPIFVSPQSAPTLATDWVTADWGSYFSPLLQGAEPDWYRHGAVQANRSARRSTLLQCGGFDESLGPVLYFNTEFGLRLRKRGVALQFLPGAVAQEIYVKSTWNIFEDNFRLAQGAWHTCRKHPEFRPHTALAGMAQGGLGKRWFRSVAARMPLDPAWALRVPLWVTERLRAIPEVRDVGLRLMGKGFGIGIWRAAAREAGSWEALRREFGVRLPVLMYHNVGPYRQGTVKSLTVSPDLFRRQMRWLAHRGYTGISAAQWVEWRRCGKPLPTKPVLLTFDDAYEDIVEHALPVVRELGFGATVFVITTGIGKMNVWEKVEGQGTLRGMSAQQIREWAGKGIEFGAHSRTHPFLTTLHDAALETEIAGSRDELAELLGTPVVSFAYPYGDHNEEVQASARRNFAAAFTTKEGMNTLQTDTADLRRTMVWPDNSIFDLALKLRLGTSPITQHFRGRVKHAIGKRWKALFD
jgi:GT2 family glycosyltransferase/peptidoglycan/xylan/chitin deacetylase (PgdA/CDA1 family)